MRVIGTWTRKNQEPAIYWRQFTARLCDLRVAPRHVESATHKARDGNPLIGLEFTADQLTPEVREAIAACEAKGGCVVET